MSEKVIQCCYSNVISETGTGGGLAGDGLLRRDSCTDPGGICQNPGFQCDFAGAKGGRMEIR